MKLHKALKVIFNYINDERKRKSAEIMEMYNRGAFNTEKWHLERIAKAEADVREKKEKLEELLKPQEELKQKIAEIQDEIKRLSKERDYFYKKDEV